MRAISFYSFKGGVGRTSLVLNLAYELAMRAKFVVVADWDLHAPGLSLMEDLAMPGGPFPRKGILDFLSSALPPLGMSGDVQADVIDPFLLAQGTLLAERSRPEYPTFGDIYFIPAGSFGSGGESAYPAELRQLRLPELTTWRARLQDADHEQSVLRFFRERVESVRSPIFGQSYKPDFLLLDSRTGITEIGDLLLGNAVDHYVVLFGLNEQNQVGMEMIVRDVQRRVKPGSLPDALTLVASPVPVGEEDLLRERLSTLTARLRGIARPMGDTGTRETLPAVLRIPYHPRLALREEIILERYPESTLAQTYRDIAGHVLQEDRAPERAAALTRGQVLAEVPPGSPSGIEAIVPALGLPFMFRTSMKAPRPFAQPPPWNWVAPRLSVDNLIPDTTHSAMLLDGLAWSASLDVQEKVRVLEFASSLPAPRIARLAEPFGIERSRLEGAWDSQWQVIEKNHARAAVEWIEVLGEVAGMAVPSFHSSLADRIEEALPRSLATPRFLFLVAREWLARGRLPSAARLLERVLHDDAFAPVAGRAAAVIERLGELDMFAAATGHIELLSENERNAFEAVLTIQSEDINSWLRAIAGLRMAGWTEDAIALADRTSALEIADAFDTWLELSSEYQQLNHLPSAEAALRRALTHQPDSCYAWALMARCLGVQGRHDDAVAALEEARGHATSVDDWRIVATAYGEGIGDYRTGLDLYYHHVILKTEPSFQYELEMAEIAMGARALEQAEDALKRARILSKGPIARGISRWLGTTDAVPVEFVLEMALGLLRKDERMVSEAAEQLIALRGRYKPQQWYFEPFLATLSELSGAERELLQGAAEVARGASPKRLEDAYSEWSVARATS